MSHLDDIFGCLVFNDSVMQQRLPKETYKALKKTMQEGRKLDPQLATVIAHAMKEWAVENGATHYTHWFQPMTGITAEKHDSFITPQSGGKMILSFSSNELVHGEPDASSLPSGGLRSTFEARGYTTWDPTSYAFIKDGVLCIPTAFCSYGGEALDKKTPLLRSMEALNKQAVRILHLFGRMDATRVVSTVGPEQEYFLVDRKLFDRRKDLIFAGRTLFGAKPPKGQELDDHYFGTIPSRVVSFMKELNEELWKLGISAKTEHNETAPAQHELATVFEVCNVAADQNQLIMEMMKRVAERHDLVCLLTEKPFQGVNGSGKHNNWSMVTNTGYNLLDPSDSPYESGQFLLFLVSVIQAVDNYQDLLRVSSSSAGNDHRLGAQEAPPAIVSMFLGDELTDVLEAIENGTDYHSPAHADVGFGVHTLPRFPKDTTDRNRTSPFAFTGNKFEFRSVGSSASVSDANVVLNTIVAESLRLFADELENVPKECFKTRLRELICRTIREHKRIIFNGNNYTAAWVEESARRGLLNLPSTVDALPALLDEKNICLFETHRVLNRTELHARYEMRLNAYAKVIHIEAATMLLMAKEQILPAVIRYSGEIARSIKSVKDVSPALNTVAAEHLLLQLTTLTGSLNDAMNRLSSAVNHNKPSDDAMTVARYMHDEVLAAMNAVRAAADALEDLVARDRWPLPTYDELLYSIR